jgi:gluconokinase
VLTQHLIVMGVAGVGKSTIAQRLAADLDLELAEGDDFHPPANVAKMSSGQPLTDEDRWPWLNALADWTARQRAAGRSTVLTCSALRRVYRNI